jgi:threonine/homoserine/homoserine lactone efflux protein
MNWQLFAAFLGITMILVLTPGPNVTLIISTGSTRGIRAALVTVAGTSTGNAILITAIAFGLRWVLANASYLFEIMRWCGAVYLIWLGIKTWRGAGLIQPILPANHVHFFRGLLVAISNPKTIVFFTAFLPQFVDAHLPVGPQLAAMCTVSILLAACSDSGWAIASGLGRGWLMQPKRAKALGRLSGLTLAGGGIWLSLARHPS